MQDRRLSTNFWIRELIFSPTAARLGRSIDPDEQIIENAERLATEVLEPIRAHLGGPVILVDSWYRPDWLNKAVGGSKTSEHMDGRAVDFRAKGFTPLQVCRAIKTIIHTLPINQLIWEFGQWTHVSVAKPGDVPKRIILTAQHINGAVSYSSGLPDMRAAA